MLSPLHGRLKRLLLVEGLLVLDLSASVVSVEQR
jgi:hypothetical protein